MSIGDEIKSTFKSGSILTKLIYINIGVFITVRLLHTFAFLFLGGSENDIIEWLAVPADTTTLLYRPWTLITYMFLHFDFLHILFNMLILFWFGRIFLDRLQQRHLLAVYLIGGIFGGLLFILSFNLFPVFDKYILGSVALGASASVMAVVVAISFYIPDYALNLVFIGKVKMKYLALIYIALDVLSIAGENPGGHIAHLGGALFGILFIMQYRKGKDITKGFSKFLERIFSFFRPSPKMKVKYKEPKKPPRDDYEYNASKAAEQEEINRILEKISKSGYDSLTKEEKERLFRMSNKN